MEGRGNFSPYLSLYCPSLFSEQGQIKDFSNGEALCRDIDVKTVAVIGK